MAELDLPSCIVRSPDCGACGDELSHDGDSFYCENCHLDYGDGSETYAAEYRDEDEPQCGHPCSNTWHNSADLGPYDCKPCQLPESHNSEHYTNCTPLWRTETSA